MAKMVDGMFTQQTPEALREQIRTRMFSTPQQVLASAMEGMMALATEWQDRPRRFEAPALAVMARRAGRAGYQDYLRGIFPNLAGYEEWDGAGHFLMMEQPERFNAVLAGFLEAR